MSAYITEVVIGIIAALFGGGGGALLLNYKAQRRQMEASTRNTEVDRADKINDMALELLGPMKGELERAYATIERLTINAERANEEVDKARATIRGLEDEVQSLRVEVRQLRERVINTGTNPNIHPIN